RLGTYASRRLRRARRARASTGLVVWRRARASTLDVRAVGRRAHADGGRAIQHVERFGLTAGVPQHAAPGESGRRRVPPAALSFEQLHRLSVRLAGAFRVVGERKRLAEGGEGDTTVGRGVVARQLDGARGQGDSCVGFAAKRRNSGALRRDLELVLLRR